LSKTKRLKMKLRFKECKQEGIQEKACSVPLFCTKQIGGKTL
jgi:hypothetical protein